jgi:hypothetical protein
MTKIRFVGLDVHAETIAVAVAEPGGEIVESISSDSSKAFQVRGSERHYISNQTPSGRFVDSFGSSRCTESQTSGFARISFTIRGIGNTGSGITIPVRRSTIAPAGAALATRRSLGHSRAFDSRIEVELIGGDL